MRDYLIPPIPAEEDHEPRVRLRGHLRGGDAPFLRKAQRPASPLPGRRGVHLPAVPEGLLSGLLAGGCRDRSGRDPRQPARLRATPGGGRDRGGSRLREAPTCGQAPGLERGAGRAGWRDDRIEWIRRWKIEAASTASAPPSRTAATKSAGPAAPPEAMTGTETPSVIARSSSVSKPSPVPSRSIDVTSSSPAPSSTARWAHWTASSCVASRPPLT